MFQFPRLPPAAYVFCGRAPGLKSRRVLPFGDPRLVRACAPGRGLSRLVASFVGFLCQGIHRVPLVSFAPASPAPFSLTYLFVHDAIH